MTDSPNLPVEPQVEPALHPKVAAAGISGAVTTVLMYALTLLGVTLPPEVAAAVVTICSFFAGYFTHS